MSPEQATGGPRTDERTSTRWAVWPTSCSPATRPSRASQSTSCGPMSETRRSPPSSVLREHHDPAGPGRPGPALPGQGSRRPLPDGGRAAAGHAAHARPALQHVRRDHRVPQAAPTTGPQQKLTEGWHSLDGSIPSILFPSTLDSAMDSQPVTVTGAQPISSPEKLREEYHDVLRELAIALVQAALASAELQREPVAAADPGRTRSPPSPGPSPCPSRTSTASASSSAIRRRSCATPSWI